MVVGVPKLKLGEPVSEVAPPRSRITNEPRKRTRLRRSGVESADEGGCKYMDVEGCKLARGGGVALQCHTYSRDYNFFSHITM